MQSVLSENSRDYSDVKFATTYIDLGLMPMNSEKRIQFDFQNISDRVIQIVGLKKSCKCVEDLQYPNGDIKPGERGSIEATIEPAEGKKDSLILLKYSNGEHQVLKISSNGYYDIQLLAENSKANLGHISQAHGKSYKTFVYGNRDLYDADDILLRDQMPDWISIKIVSIENVMITNEQHSALTDKIKQSGLSPLAEVELVVMPQAPLGHFQEKISFAVSCTNDEERILKLRCFGDIVPEIAAYPSQLIVVPMQYGSSMDLIIRSVNEVFGIERIESEHVECRWETKTSLSNEAKIIVTIPENSKFMRDTITAYTNHPDNSKLDIPVIVKSL
jgi:hypothetical protein